MINLIFLFIHVYFCFNFITYANRYIIAFLFLSIIPIQCLFFTRQVWAEIANFANRWMDNSRNGQRKRMALMQKK